MSRNLTADLAADLRTRIVDGAIQPGEKLPSENTLISEFGVSRTVVRSALTRLQAEGLVETERGRGSFALTPPAEGPAAAPGTRPVSSMEDRLQMLDFRIGVETEAAALAAKNHTEHQLKAVHGALEQFTASSGHPGPSMKADFEFHRAVAAATGNPFYTDCISALGQTMITMPRPRLVASEDQDSPERFAQVVHEHASIYVAIADGDQVAAAAAMRLHLSNSRRRFTASARG
ncbi:FadR/GntR family transcriptional regulator [Paenarthrobacter nitroguajacolicus]|uniref:FadR/GntR family transcriptional regulator n=1 Tax=Paenarthrobacter nitroguajacolicus TaxID=211146 RepID=UPI002856B1F8|nr:FadR/GntR family transcriptional regulator [Paenarthrobacter nitroguajacolicus]MDR6638680.1 GntR family transcriptional repressor for pyruvate dehydrogenase complex [Paenarthrobacter nitroguajacolicus]